MGLKPASLGHPHYGGLSSFSSNSAELDKTSKIPLAAIVANQRFATMAYLKPEAMKFRRTHVIQTLPAIPGVPANGKFFPLRNSDKNIHPAGALFPAIQICLYVSLHKG